MIENLVFNIALVIQLYKINLIKTVITQHKIVTFTNFLFCSYIKPAVVYCTQINNVCRPSYPTSYNLYLVPYL